MKPHYLPLAFITLALAGCGHNAGHKVIEPPKEARIPIAEKCKPKLPDKPVYADNVVDLGADIHELVKALLIGRDQRTVREAQLSGAVNACAGN